ncbi:MAG TPA: galactokinase [Clostridiaceae bacterium]|mgnify:CR=1 FL=1|jgi:galactokinase|nr:galactokinase [Clostridiaceae bacterium]
MKKLTEEFIRMFGKSDRQIRFFAAPGRVNLIGEHIDYCGGYVFPAALTLDNVVAVRENGTSKMNMCATDLARVYTADLSDIDKAKELKWGNYQAGMAKELLEAGINVRGVDMLYDSTLPFGAGLSSSASIEVVTGYALASLFANEMPNRIEIALMGKRCENNFVGVNCGIMDQFASAMGKKDCAILLNCDTLEYEYVPLDLGDYVLILANTNVKHKLGSSKYNERRQEVEKGLSYIHTAAPDDKRPYLCNYTVEDYLKYDEYITDDIIRKRVKHVIYENERVLHATKVLKQGDLVSFGQILCEANDSIRYLYEVTGIELDTLFDLAMEEEGCIGSRMTGAGFGGCTVNIVHKDKIESFKKNVGGKYTERTGLQADFYICRIGDGVREVSVNN